MWRSVLRWSGILLLTLGAGSCSGCHDDAPVPKHDVCSPDVSQYAGPFKEPSTPDTPDIHVSGTDPGAHFQVNFPPESNAGTKRLTYWLTDDEDLVVKVELGLGPQSGFPAAVNVLTGVFIDGTLVHGTVGGVDTAVTASALTVGAVASLSIVIGHAAIVDGAHSAAVLSWVDDGKNWGGWSFTILKNGFQFGAVVDDGQPVSGMRDVGVYDDGTGQLLIGPYAPLAPAAAPFHAVLGSFSQDCPTTPVGLAVVGVIDGAQASLSGSSVRATVTTAASNKVIPFEVTLPPAGDGRTHHLIFWELRGFGKFAEAPSGARAPWAGTPVRIGVAVWGP